MTKESFSSTQTLSTPVDDTSAPTATTTAWTCSLCGQPGQWWWEVCSQVLCLCERCYTLNRQRRFDDIYQSLSTN